MALQHAPGDHVLELVCQREEAAELDVSMCGLEVVAAGTQ
jgi:hypothetical protein